MGCSLTWMFRVVLRFRGHACTPPCSSRRQRERFAVGAINLRLEEEVRRQSLGLRRIDPALRVANQERSGGGLIVRILDAELHLRRSLRVEEQVDRTAESQVLRALADIEVESRLALSGVAGEEAEDAVFQRQSREVGTQGLLVEHFDIQELPPMASSGVLARRPALGLSTASTGVLPAWLLTLMRKVRQPCCSSSAVAGPSIALTRDSGLISTPTST